MAEGFQSIHFSAAAADEQGMERAGARPLTRRAGPTLSQQPKSFESAEAAARFYLSNVLAGDTRPGMRGLTAPHSPQVVPDLRLRDSKPSPLTRTSIVRFEQTKESVPVFGANAVVELDQSNDLLSIDAQLAQVDEVSPIAAIAPKQAIASIAKLVQADSATLTGHAAPELNFFRDDEKGRWHLVWYVRNVPAAPPDFVSGLKSHGHGSSLAFRAPQLDYLVDAHDGAVVRYWSSNPTLVRCTGRDESGVVRTFYGSARQGKVALSDPLRRIVTIDLGFKSIEASPLPTDPFSLPSSDFSDCTAVVSAHFNASRVADFLRSVLMRDGVDDKGMEIVSYVNCASPGKLPSPDWPNAVWWQQRMWYGQKRQPSGQFRSFAEHLDIIAHELAHGVTEFTSNLVYMNQSGALNESFSDIFGIIIRNWDASEPETGGDTAGWNWEIGSNLGHGNRPLRDMRDPGRTGEPAHMDQYSTHPADNGGVHTNSNIHNKAAYVLLTARHADGSAVIPPREVAVLYYLTLQRLDRLASFRHVRATLLNVASTYFLGDARKAEKLNTIRSAYDGVGIR